jgi:hypothetical protein
MQFLGLVDVLGIPSLEVLLGFEETVNGEERQWWFPPIGQVLNPASIRKKIL